MEAIESAKFGQIRKKQNDGSDSGAVGRLLKTADTQTGLTKIHYEMVHFRVAILRL